MRRTIERELKLDAPPGFVLPPVAGAALDARVFTSTYHDTPPRTLARAGITLRRRLENGMSLWQLKLPRGGDARAELEAPGGPAGPPEEIRRLLVAHLRHGDLEPIATLRTRRSGVHAERDGTPVAEVTVDDVDVLDAGRAAGSFREIEIELTGGGGADLKRLGKKLRRAGAADGDGAPKVFRLIEVSKARPPGRSAPFADHLHHLLAAQLRAIETHDPGVRLGDNPEDLHRLRVATRRTRSLLRATRTLAPLTEELKWLATVLGEVRDLDVLTEHLEHEVAGLGEDAAAGSLILDALRGERDVHRAQLVEALDSERYSALLRSFDAALAAPPAADTDVVRLARVELRKLRKHFDRLPKDVSDDELHDLRKRAKRARYAGELAALAGGKPVARYVDALKVVQDVIGEHQDAVVAEEKLRTLARAGTGVAAGRLIAAERQRRIRARASYEGALRRAFELGAKVVGA